MDGTELEQNTILDGHSQLPEDADEFTPVPNSGGSFDYATIADDLVIAAKMLPVPIRLVNGKHFGNGGGYGIAHILYQHSPSLARWNFFSVQDYVDHVAQGFDAVYSGRDRRLLIVKRKEPSLAVDRLLVLQLSESREFYGVVSGWPVSARRPIRDMLIAERVKKDGVLVWECRAPH